jgi:hypothetical protein
MMSDESDFQVFLCHNSKDKPTVRAVKSALSTVGIKCWIDEGELRPGELWRPAITEEISRTKSAAVFIGEQGFGPYQQKELQEFLQQTCRLIPVLLPNVSNPGKLPDFLTGHNLWEDLSERTYVLLEAPDAIGRLIWGITGKKVEEGKVEFAQLLYSQSYVTLRSKDLPGEIEKASSVLARLCDEYTKLHAELENINGQLKQVKKQLEINVDDETKRLSEYLEATQEIWIERATNHLLKHAPPELRENLDANLEYFELSVKTIVRNIQLSILKQAHEKRVNHREIIQCVVLELSKEIWSSDDRLCTDLINLYCGCFDYIEKVLFRKNEFAGQTIEQFVKSLELFRKELIDLADYYKG